MIAAWARSWRERRLLRRRIAAEIADHIEEAALAREARGWQRREALEDARLCFGDQRRIARECALALEDSPAGWREVSTGVSRGAAAALAVATPIALAYLLIPHHLRQLPGLAPQQLLISKHRAVAAFASAEAHGGEVAAFHRAASVVSAPGAEGSIQAGLKVSSSFFALQGVAPALGADFSRQEREIVLSHRLWRSEFGRDPTVVGRIATVDGERYRIAGVTAPEYWFLSSGHSFWMHTPDKAGQAAGTLLARLAHGESREDAERRVAAHSRMALRSNALTPLETVARLRLRAGLGVAKGALLMLAALGVAQLVSLVRFRCERAPPATILLRCYAFLFAKATPVIACLTILWLGAWDSGVALSGYFGDVWAFVSTFFFALASVATSWQSLVDQRLRCHVCLRKLAMPLPTGVIGSVLFDSAATEYICAHGHGALRVPHPALEQLQPPAWREPERWCLELWGPPLRG